MAVKKYTHSVVLLSGGLDSATALAIAQSESSEVTALSFDYGQRHDIELDASRRIASRADVPRRVVTIDLAQFGGSALTDKRIDVPKSGVSTYTIPMTYVPARNTIFLSYGLALAEISKAQAVYIGVNALDYSGYPDCRPEFIERFQALADVATKSTVSGNRIVIETPLIELTKAQIITKGLALGVDYALTISCYDPDRDGRACGACDSCLLRARGFREAGVKDPTKYISAVMI